jgi:hypothetical protein
VAKKCASLCTKKCKYTQKMIEIPEVGADFGVWGFIPLHSPTFPEA